jgi:hypothetical protein
LSEREQSVFDNMASLMIIAIAANKRSASFNHCIWSKSCRLIFNYPS